MHSTSRGGVAKRRNRKRKRRQAASSSSSSSSSESGSEDAKPTSVTATGKQAPFVQKEPSPNTTVSSSSSETSSSSSESEESTEGDQDEEKDEDEEMKSPKPTKRKYPSRSPSPRSSDILMSLPTNPTSEQEKLKDAEMKERFRRYWMSSVAEGFKGELEQLQKEPNMTKPKLAMLIDALASGTNIYMPSETSNKSHSGSEVELLLGIKQ